MVSFLWNLFHSILENHRESLGKRVDTSFEPESQRRELLYFPIVHNQADMGALSESVKKASLEKIGRLGWKRKVDLINRFWDEIELALGRLPNSLDRVRVYQDALPVSGKETVIVSELARSGSRNHQALLHLINRGAKLMGTESLELLLEEYESAKNMLGSRGSLKKKSQETAASAALLERRDKFIGQRINDTLRPGEVGIIFLGMLHELERWLASDIQVVYPVGRARKS
jgi:hypothetical protein